MSRSDDLPTSRLPLKAALAVPIAIFVIAKTLAAFATIIVLASSSWRRQPKTEEERYLNLRALFAP